MRIELSPYIEDYARELARWPLGEQEAKMWAGESTPFPVPPDQFRRRHDDPDIHPFVGLRAGKLIVYGELWVEDQEDEVELARIIVNPAERGVGVGRNFVAALVTHAFSLGLANLFVRVAPENVHAIRCYQAAGFVAVPTSDQERFNRGQPVAYQWFKHAAGEMPGG